MLGMHPRSEPAKLAVYQKALEIAVVFDQVAARMPERRYDLQDQLKRASASVVLNLAEGAGEFSPGDKARFYRMARRSMSECEAILDLVERIAPGLFEAGIRDDIQEVNSSLTSLIKRCEARQRTTHRRA